MVIATVKQLEEDNEVDEIGKSIYDIKMKFEFLRSTYFGMPRGIVHTRVSHSAVKAMVHVCCLIKNLSGNHL